MDKFCQNWVPKLSILLKIVLALEVETYSGFPTEILIVAVMELAWNGNRSALLRNLTSRLGTTCIFSEKESMKIDVAFWTGYCPTGRRIMIRATAKCNPEWGVYVLMCLLFHIKNHPQNCRIEWEEGESEVVPYCAPCSFQKWTHPLFMILQYRTWCLTDSEWF